MSKRILLLLLRILVASLGLAYIAFAVTWRDGTDIHGQLQPGVLTMLRQANVPLLLLGLLLTSIIFPVQTLRWWLLMRARGLNVPLAMTFKLEMVGWFFSYCMPGSTGGDLVKIYYASQRKDGRAAAMVSVLVDRIVGLLGLVLLAAVAGLLMSDNELARRILFWVWSSLGIVAIGALVYFNQTLRRWLGVQRLLERLPAGRYLNVIDQAAVAYRHHLGTVAQGVGLSLLVQIVLVGSCACAGYALGLGTPLGLLFAVAPVFFLIGAIPLTPQGVGVMEGVAIALLGSTASAATPNQIVGMLVLVRLYQVFYALWGSLFLLGGRIHLHPEQCQAQASTVTPALTPHACPSDDRA